MASHRQWSSRGTLVPFFIAGVLCIAFCFNVICKGTAYWKEVTKMTRSENERPCQVPRPRNHALQIFLTYSSARSTKSLDEREIQVIFKPGTAYWVEVTKMTRSKNERPCQVTRPRFHLRILLPS